MNATMTTNMSEVRVLTSDKGMRVETPLTDWEAVDIIDGAARSDEFSRSLVDGFRRNGGYLSNNRLVWLHRKALDVLEFEVGGVEKKPAGATENGYEKLFGLFDKVPAKIKYPTITFDLPSGSRLQLAFSRDGKYPRSISISSGPKSAGGRWYGRVQASGEFYKGYNDMPEEAADLLRAICDDPEEAAIRYGKRTGKCCFCASPLTDDSSVKLGYGPTCAQNYGLPHGVMAARRVQR